MDETPKPETEQPSEPPSPNHATEHHELKLTPSATAPEAAVTPVVTHGGTDPIPAANSTPSPSPAAPHMQMPVAETHKESHDAGTIVLQWLTYAFWGWTVLATSVLVATVLANLISKSETGGFTPYGIAAVLVLLPISIVCDVFYSKQEPIKKTGAASIVMVIHAVLFALFGIGALITAVISLVTMFTNSSDSSASQTALLSALIIFVLYVMTFLRTINPPQLPFIRRFYPIFMAVVVGIIAIMGVVGPMANAHRTKDDKLIENNLSSIHSEIESYVNSKEELPDSLDSLTLNGDEEELIALVEYKPNTKAPKTESTPSSTYYQSSSSIGTKITNKTFYYQLCVTYKEKSSGYRSYNTYDSYYDEDSDGYSDYLSSYSHPAGHICYKLSTKTDNY